MFPVACVATGSLIPLEKNKTKKEHSRYSKPKFLITFLIVMGLFAAVRHIFSIEVPLRTSETAMCPSDSSTSTLLAQTESEDIEEELIEEEEKIDYNESTIVDSTLLAVDADEAYGNSTDSLPFNHSHHATTVSSPDDNLLIEHPISDPHAVVNGRKPHRIKGVWSYDKCFPDIQDVQITEAKRHGISPVKNREEAEVLVKKHQLVNVSHSPFYKLDNLTHSMPYLVPRAQQLLNTICLNFIDSCQMKGIPVHLPIITSVLRTTDDVAQLQRGNQNATTNSCHCYGTTIDISYNKFVPVTGSYHPSQALTRWNEPMKQILSEVLDDLRQQNKVYVKYEKKQGCFHMTCR